jgi:hypothetical protein
MHCVMCNVELTDFESTRKDAETMRHLDMCNQCISESDIVTVDRFDLASDDDMEYINVPTDSWN